MLREYADTIPLTEAVDHCRCDGGQPKNVVRPCLLLLAESPAHGYELMEQLHPFGSSINDPAAICKSLRQVEEGLVSSTWETSTRGRARRVYALTSDGRDQLDAWVRMLAKNREILGQYLARFGAVQSRWSDDVASL